MAGRQHRTRTSEQRTSATGSTTSGLFVLVVILLTALLQSFGASVPSRADAGEPVIDSALVLGLANGGLGFSGPQGIALDVEHGEVVVANTGQHRVEFFDLKTFPTGYFVHRVPDPATHEPRDGNPVFVAVDLEGNVIVSDMAAAYVDVVDYRGRTVTKLRLPAPDDTTLGVHGPGAVTVGADGTIWIASRGTEGRVYRFDRDYQYVGTWGTPGTEPGQLQGITSLAVMPNGEIVVGCARTKLAIQMFDAQGGYLRGFGVHEVGPGNFSFPSGIAVTGDGRMWISDAIRHTLQVFDSSGKYLGAVGGSGVGPGEFVNPSALASDGKGMLALAENAGNRFQLMWVR